MERYVSEKHNIMYLSLETPDSYLKSGFPEYGCRLLKNPPKTCMVAVVS
jgi:hypothetical protein